MRLKNNNNCRYSLEFFTQSQGNGVDNFSGKIEKCVCIPLSETKNTFFTLKLKKKLTLLCKTGCVNSTGHRMMIKCFHQNSYSQD